MGKEGQYWRGPLRGTTKGTKEGGGEAQGAAEAGDGGKGRIRRKEKKVKYRRSVL